MANSHGSSTLARYTTARIPEKYFKEKNNISFLLALNVGVNRQPLDPTKIYGSAITDQDGVRIDTSDYGLFWSPSVRRGMALTFGYTQSGKGGLIVPAALTYSGNMVFNDPKGELWWLSGTRRQQGFGKAVLCDPFDEVNTGYASKVGKHETITRYNPLAHLDATRPDFAELVAAIGEALAINLDSGNSIFSGTGRDLIEGVIAAEATMNPGRATLREVRRWLTLSDPDFSAAVTAYLADYPTGLAAAKLRQFTDMTSRMNQSTKGTAKEQTKFLDSEQIVSYFEPEPGEATFSFEELATGKLSVYIVLPGRLLGSYSAFTRLMFNQALDTVGRIRQENMSAPVTFICDEAGTSLGRLDAIEQAYGLSAGTGILIWSFYQDIAQLKADYPKSYNTFISNSSAITLLGARDEETCEYFSKYLGNSTITVTSPGQSTSSSTGGQHGSTSTSQSSTTSATGRPVMFPEEIRDMKDYEMLVMIPGVGNSRQVKVRYFEDARFTGKYRPDPKYRNTTPPSENAAMPLPQPTGNAGSGANIPCLIGGVLCGVFALALVVALMGGSQASGIPFMLIAAAASFYLLRKGWPKPRSGGDTWIIAKHPSGYGYISH